MNARPIHFLLVEDDDGHADLVNLAMNENRVTNTLDRVCDGAEALAYVHARAPFADRQRPDVILLDLKLPKVDGLDVLAQLKADRGLRTIPVVILTTSAMEADRTKAYTRHANSYLVKPVDFTQFHTMIRDLNLYWSVWNQPPKNEC